jgi:hypothetical protein
MADGSLGGGGTAAALTNMTVTNFASCAEALYHLHEVIWLLMIAAFKRDRADSPPSDDGAFVDEFIL